MTLFTRTLLVAAIAGGSTLAIISEAQAGCGGGSRRSYGFRPRITYAPRPVYHPPAPAPCSHPPVVQQPIAQPIGQPIGQPGLPPQPAQQIPAQPGQQPAQQAPAANPAPQTVQPQPGSAAPASTAQLTALQALAGMSTSQPQSPANPNPPQPQQQPGQAGVWTAKLANGAQVRLTLQANGQFSWSATNQGGRQSSFSGSYTIGGGNLTLIRSTDNQKLAGTMTQTGTNGFNFKLTGAKDTGLNFVRA